MALAITRLFLLLVFQAPNLQVEKARQNQPLNRVIYATLILFFISITDYRIINFIRMLEAIFSTNGSPAAINQYFSRVDVKYFAKLSLYESHLLLADIVMTCRLYHIFGRNLWICIPVFLAIPGHVVCQIGLSYLSAVTSLASGMWKQQVLPWVIAAYTLTMFINLYSSMLICGKLYLAESQWASPTGQRVWKIFVESAAPVTIIDFVICVALLAGSNLGHALIDVTSPVVGISFCLIIIRLTPEIKDSPRGSVNMLPRTFGYQSGSGYKSGNHHPRTIDVDVFYLSPVEDDTKDRSIGQPDENMKSMA